MSEDMIRSIQNLIDSGRGDLNRLHEILNTIKQKTPLYFSDYRYLEDLFSQKEEQESKTEEKSDKKKSKKEVKKEEKKEDTKQKHDTNKAPSGALSILKNRLASGEITLEEFQALKKIIQES
ncbi:MAG: SHOCT domain-containing protein [Nitrosopumilaceae archaeon]